MITADVNMNAYKKPDVGRQVEWDLGAFRLCMWMFEHYVFDLVGPRTKLEFLFV